jgi:hypothetical protein
MLDRKINSAHWSIRMINFSDFNFALMYAPSVSVSGPNTFDPARTIELEMNQHQLVAGYSKRF